MTETLDDLKHLPPNLSSLFSSSNARESCSLGFPTSTPNQSNHNCVVSNDKQYHPHSSQLPPLDLIDLIPSPQQQQTLPNGQQSPISSVSSASTSSTSTAEPVGTPARDQDQNQNQVTATSFPPRRAFDDVSQPSTHLAEAQVVKEERHRSQSKKPRNKQGAKLKKNRIKKNKKRTTSYTPNLKKPHVDDDNEEQFLTYLLKADYMLRENMKKCGDAAYNAQFEKELQKRNMRKDDASRTQLNRFRANCSRERVHAEGDVSKAFQEYDSDIVKQIVHRYRRCKQELLLLKADHASNTMQHSPIQCCAHNHDHDHDSQTNLRGQSSSTAQLFSCFVNSRNIQAQVNAQAELISDATPEVNMSDSINNIKKISTEAECSLPVQESTAFAKDGRAITTNLNNDQSLVNRSFSDGAKRANKTPDDDVAMAVMDEICEDNVHPTTDRPQPMSMDRRLPLAEDTSIRVGSLSAAHSMHNINLNVNIIEPIDNPFASQAFVPCLQSGYNRTGEFVRAP